MSKDKTKEIFTEVYSENYILTLIEKCKKKYPFLVDNQQLLKSTAIVEEKMRRYYAQGSDIISAHLIAQQADNREKGWSNE